MNKLFFSLVTGAALLSLTGCYTIYTAEAKAPGAGAYYFTSFEPGTYMVYGEIHRCEFSGENLVCSPVNVKKDKYPGE
jgi:hypothetical protein